MLKPDLVSLKSTFIHVVIYLSFRFTLFFFYIRRFYINYLLFLLFCLTFKGVPLRNLHRFTVRLYKYIFKEIQLTLLSVMILRFISGSGNDLLYRFLCNQSAVPKSDPGRWEWCIFRLVTLLLTMVSSSEIDPRRRFLYPLIRVR